jgi:hypothetical protein
MAERRRSATRADDGAAHDETELDEAERNEAEANEAELDDAELDDAELDDAEPEEPERGRRGRPKRHRARHNGAGNGGQRLSAAAAGRAGLQQIIELTGKDPETITGVRRSEDGWLITVEVIEDRRIPSSTDILSTYETELDADGELLSYRRVRRYSRGRGDDGGS